MLTVWVTILTVLPNFFLGYLILTRNRRSATNKIFALLTFVIIIWSLLNYFSLNTINVEEAIFWIRMVMASVSVMFPIIYLLARNFPASKMNIGLWDRLAVLFSVFCMVLLSNTSLIFSGVDSSNGSMTPVPGKLIPLYGIYVLGYLISTFIILIKKMREFEGVKRAQVRMMFYGLVFTFVSSFITTFIFVVVLGETNFVLFGPLYSLFLVGFVAYAIVRHRFLDINFLVARTVTYSLLIIFVIAIEAVFMITVSRVLPYQIDSTVLLIVGSIVIALSYEGVNRGITRITEKVFFHGRYKTEELLARLNDIMSEEIRITVLTNKLLKVIVEDMRLTFAGFELMDGAESSTLKVVGLPDGKKLKDERLGKMFCNRNEVVIFDDLNEGDCKSLMRDIGASVISPMFVKDKNIGLIILGPKASGEMFHKVDLEFLEILTPQVSVAINNAKSYRKIQNFSRTLEKRVQERTRELKLAQKSELKKAKELLKLKDEFLFIATHDLATPVTAITGYVELINTSKVKLNSDLQENLSAITESSERLSQLVEDLLEVARSESNKIVVDVEPVEIFPIVDSTVKMLSQRANNKGVKINVDVSKKDKVMADPDKLSEVMENLVSNAIKYSKKKGGRVELRSEVRGKYLSLYVEDNGIGISDEEKDMIFQKFFRSESSEVRSVSGTGLGLFVVRMLVERMRGKVGFESVEGEGTTFWIKLPVA